jgi:hypothetical protein
MYTHTRRYTTRALVALASLVVLVPLGAARERVSTRSCGILVDAAHPWHSHTQDASVETGDHWIIARDQPASTCAFTRRMVHGLLALLAWVYEGRTYGKLLGGICIWDTGSRTERVRPFQHVLRSFSVRVVRHRDVTVDVVAYVDPDPRFITR